MKTILGILLAVVLCGCAATKMPTESGRPEVVLPGTVAEVKPRLVAAVLAKGYTVTASDDLRVVAEKDAGLGAAVAMSLGTGASSDGAARTRAQFTLLPVPAGTRVVADLWLVNRTLGGENVVPQEGSRARASLQSFLSGLR